MSCSISPASAFAFSHGATAAACAIVGQVGVRARGGQASAIVASGFTVDNGADLGLGDQFELRLEDRPGVAHRPEMLAVDQGDMGHVRNFHWRSPCLVGLPDQRMTWPRVPTSV